jgi:hypothetical protein
VPRLEKEIFGSVTSSFDVVFPPPPLWHEASKITVATRIKPAARSIRFRIRNSSCANFGCKPVLRGNSFAVRPFMPVLLRKKRSRTEGTEGGKEKMLGAFWVSTNAINGGRAGALLPPEAVVSPSIPALDL